MKNKLQLFLTSLKLVKYSVFKYTKVADAVLCLLLSEAELWDPTLIAPRFRSWIVRYILRSDQFSEVESEQKRIKYQISPRFSYLMRSKLSALPNQVLKLSSDRSTTSVLDSQVYSEIRSIFIGWIQAEMVSVWDFSGIYSPDVLQILGALKLGRASQLG